MDYWIDGYNLLFKLNSYTKSLEQSREGLINELKLHLIKSNLRAKIIFDSNEENSSDFPSVKSKTPLEILFSPKGMSADDYIIEMLHATKSAKNTTVVTNDTHLAFSCKNTQAWTMSIDDFFKFVFKEERERNMSNYEFLKESGEEMVESEENIQMFIKIFEERQDRNS